MRARAAFSEPGRYAMGGGLCALLHNAVMIGADRASIHYLPALCLSFVSVTPVGYAYHTLFTFRQRFSIARFGRFATGVAAGLPASLAIMALLCTGFGVAVAIATPIATALLFLYNYLAARWSIRRPAEAAASS